MIHTARIINPYQPEEPCFPLIGNYETLGRFFHGRPMNPSQRCGRVLLTTAPQTRLIQKIRTGRT